MQYLAPFYVHKLEIFKLAGQMAFGMFVHPNCVVLFHACYSFRALPAKVLNFHMNSSWKNS